MQNNAIHINSNKFITLLNYKINISWTIIYFANNTFLLRSNNLKLKCTYHKRKKNSRENSLLSAVDDDIKCCVAVERQGVFEESRQRNGSAQSTRKIEQTTASESRSDYLLEITFLFPLSLVAAEGNGEKRERERAGAEGERRERQRARECYLISKPCMLHGWEIYQGKYQWPHFSNGQTDFGSTIKHLNVRAANSILPLFNTIYYSV